MNRAPERPSTSPPARSRAGATPLEGIRRRIASSVTSITQSGASPIDYSAPPGDPGLFGPDSVCWRVHADFVSMLVGGVGALLLQALHPLALAGVWDHSTFREDIQGRLGRTARFIAGTTYASRADALELLERVRQIHLRVVGTASDGRPYAASDPDLLTWVHVAETSSFLAAHLRYVNPRLSQGDQDRYFDEMALVAEALGARGVPRSGADTRRYLEAMRGELRADARTAEVLRVLRQAPAPNVLLQPGARLLVGAGGDLLPRWAQEMLGIAAFAPVRRLWVGPMIRSIAPVVRWSLTEGISKRARARVASGGPPHS